MIHSMENDYSLNENYPIEILLLLRGRYDRSNLLKTKRLLRPALLRTALLAMTTRKQEFSFSY